MKSGESQMDLVSRYLSGQASFEEVETLEALMLEDSQLRADFLACARVDAALPAAIGEKMAVTEFRSDSSKERGKSRWAPVLAAAAVVALSVVGGLWWAGSQSPSEAAPVVARFGNLSDCRWVDSAARIATGDAVESGRRIELSAGSAELIFGTGARLELVGRAIVELRSKNGVFLTLGEVHLVAETPESKGFTIETPTSKFIDVSTAFTAAVSPDGLSRVEVTDGEVDVVLAGEKKARRLRAGQTMFVEQGDQKIVTRIEAGDGTPAFHFPTIEPPSNRDYADGSQGRASIELVYGEFKPEQSHDGLLERLNDGRGQSKPDSPSESVFFATRSGGAFLIDLGEAISISKINTYSWHQHEELAAHRERATQRFILYGFSGVGVPDIQDSTEEARWTRIARVNSDEYFRIADRRDLSDRLNRPAQQGCSITAAEGEIGRYRYLLMEVRPSTFYGEIDIYEAD